MKTKITLILSALVMSINLLMAQSPGTINYQGVARDTMGNPIANQQIRLRFKILDNAVNGPVEFTEVRKVTTSASGLFNCQIGGAGAISQSNSLLTLPWHDGNKFLKVEMDPTGGVSYINMGTQQLASTPYALNAMQAEGLAPNKFLPYNQIDTTYAKSGYFMGFDGFSWGPRSLLPYNVADPNLVSFAITNTSAFGGQALYGMNTVDHANATGVRGECNKANGRGVYGKAIGASAFGVFGENTTGVGIKGSATGAGGIGVVGQSTSGYGIKGITTSSVGNIAGVIGEHNGTNGRGVVGVANAASCYGVEGTSNNGIGVMGYSNNNIGVYGSVISGTALKGYAISGYGLDVTGNVKISGGNTTPGAGKVLTSDASGNATWQNPALTPKVGFLARGLNPAGGNLDNVILSLTWTKVLFYYETADYGTCFNAYGQTNQSSFVAPVNGFYNLSTTVNWVLNPAYNYQQADIRLVLKRNGSTSYIAVKESWIDEMDASVDLNIQTPLQAGDIVYVEVRQSNLLVSTQNISVVSDETFFSGNLLFTY